MKNGKVAIFAEKDTMKRHFETALQIDKERQSVILQSIGDAVIATDMDGSIILMNPVAEKLTGWKFSSSSKRYAKGRRMRNGEGATVPRKGQYYSNRRSSWNDVS